MKLTHWLLSSKELSTQMTSQSPPRLLLSCDSSHQNKQCLIAVGSLSYQTQTQSACFESHTDWILFSILSLISNEIQKTFSFMFQRKSLKVAPKSSSVLWLSERCYRTVWLCHTFQLHSMFPGSKICSGYKFEGQVGWLSSS